MTTESKVLNYMEIANVKLSDLTFEEDYVILYECQDCGYTDDEEEEECSECGSDNLINDTAHEDSSCSCCGGFIDIWEDCYVNGNDNICKDCYSVMEKIEAKK